MIEVTPTIALDEGEIEMVPIRASGPGGQNVNKVSSAVQLRFDALGSPSLPDPVKARLPAIAGSRMTKDGVIVITAQVYRDQERNRADAIARLVDLIRRAAYRPPPRRPTRPTLGSKRRRLDTKAKHARTKSLRGKPPAD
ncbi:MAG: alternative ribosome rescue aminoacyl-tRNA hydrolase ArfB [Salinarimonas sp.]